MACRRGGFWWATRPALLLWSFCFTGTHQTCWSLYCWSLIFIWNVDFMFGFPDCGSFLLLIIFVSWFYAHDGIFPWLSVLLRCGYFVCVLSLLGGGAHYFVSYVWGSGDVFRSTLWVAWSGFFRFGVFSFFLLLLPTLNLIFNRLVSFCWLGIKFSCGDCLFGDALVVGWRLSLGVLYGFVWGCWGLCWFIGVILWYRRFSKLGTAWTIRTIEPTTELSAGFFKLKII